MSKTELQRPSVVGRFVRAATEGLRDVRRSVVRAPGRFSLVLATLALVTGASTAVFSVASRTIWRPLAFKAPERLVVLGESNRQRDWRNVNATPADVLEWRERLKSTEDVAFYNDQVSDLPLTVGNVSSVVRAVSVSGNYLSVVGAATFLGTTFTFDDTWADVPPSVVLDYGAWRDRFGGNPDVVGRTVQLDGFPYEVRGVLAPGFDAGMGRVDVWVPLRWESARQTSQWFRQAHVVRPIARLKAGATLEGLVAELTPLDRQLARERPSTNQGVTTDVTPIVEYLGGDRLPIMWWFLAAALTLQIVGCANVSALLVARAEERRREYALRAALGADRAQTLITGITEAFLLAGIGAAGGVALAWGGLDVLNALRPSGAGALTFQGDWRSWSFVSGSAFTSALLFGVWPAWRIGRRDVAPELASFGRSATPSRRSLRGLHVLLGAEVTLAVLLTLGASALLRGVHELQHVDLGSNTTNVLSFALNPPSAAYGDDDVREAMVADLLERLRALPGVVDAVGVRQEPLAGFSWTSDFTIEAWAADRFGLDVRHRQMSANYFRTLQVPVLAGRPFKDRPAKDEPFEVVVNQAFVDRYLPGQSPIGRGVTFSRTRSDATRWHRIVGVVGNERMAVRQGPLPEILGPLMSDMPGIPHILVRTDVPAASIVPAARAALENLDSRVAMFGVRTLDDVIAQALAPERFAADVLGAFAAAALALAAIAVYGLTSQTVRIRTDEIRIRRVLGAANCAIVGTLARPLSAVLVTGFVLGLASAAAAGQAAAAWLLQPAPTDPPVVGGALAWLVAATVTGLLVPLRRALRVVPTAGE